MWRSGVPLKQPIPKGSVVHLPSHTNSELSERSVHFGCSGGEVFATGYDFNQQWVIVRGDDGPLKRRRTIQTDAHTFSTAKHLLNDERETEIRFKSGEILLEWGWV